MGLVLWFSIFCGWILHTALTYVALLSFGLYLWKINSIVSVPACAFRPWDRRTSSLHMEFVHTCGSLFTKSLYPRTFQVVSQVMWCATYSTGIIYIFGVCFINIVWAYMCCLCVCHILFEHLRCILECCHMIYFGPGIILVCAFSCYSYDTLFLLFFSLVTCGNSTGVSAFIFPNLIFVIFNF